MYTTGICDRLFVIGGAKRLCGQSGSFSSWLLLGIFSQVSCRCQL